MQYSTTYWRDGSYLVYILEKFDALLGEGEIYFVHHWLQLI